MEVVAIIPARGGSVSIPRKNLIPFKGLPLVTHSILYAKNDPLINRVIVSTDDEEIASISRAYGAEIPFIRPRMLSNDNVPTFPVIKHATDILCTSGYRSDLTIVLEPTMPERPSWLVKGCQDIFIKNPDCDSIFSVYPAPVHPIKIFIEHDKGMKPVMPQELVRQDFKHAYVVSGHIKAYRTDFICSSNSNSWGRIVMPLLIPETVPSIDIDTPDDLKMFLANPRKRWWQ